VTRRLGIARRLSDAYGAKSKVAALSVTGSVGAGLADAYSDLELDCYWQDPPTDTDRSVPKADLGANELVLWPYDADDEEWSDDFVLDGVSVCVSGFLVASIDRFIDDVISEADTDLVKQLRLSALRRSVPLIGNEQLESWRARIADYPDALMSAMVTKALDPQRLPCWGSRRALVSRGDWFAIHELLVRAERMVLTSLFALNRTFISHPLFKWQEAAIANFTIAPADIAARLDALWEEPALTSLNEVRGLLLEVGELAHQHAAFDQRLLAATLNEQRSDG